LLIEQIIPLEQDIIVDVDQLGKEHSQNPLGILLQIKKDGRVQIASSAYLKMTKE
jgi:hypothetical protein